MRRRRAFRPQRTRVFLGCEGESEVAYGQLLNKLLQAADQPFHLEVVALSPGAGDPMVLVTKATRDGARRAARRGVFRWRFILMDADRVARDAQRRAQVERDAQSGGLTVIWQDPCHEAFLLRHLDGCTGHRPPSAATAMQALQREWPGYSKPMTSVALARRIDVDAVRRAATVEPLFGEFLRKLKLV